MPTKVEACLSGEKGESISPVLRLGHACYHHRSRCNQIRERSVIAVTDYAHSVDGQGTIALASRIVHFAGLPDRDRKAASPLPRLAAGDRLELHVRRAGGKERTLSIPPSAVAVYDACVLYPFHPHNVLIQCTFDGFVETR
jgi:hypothetical protein